MSIFTELVLMIYLGIGLWIASLYYEERDIPEGIQFLHLFVVVLFWPLYLRMIW